MHLLRCGEFHRYHKTNSQMTHCFPSRWVHSYSSLRTCNAFLAKDYSLFPLQGSVKITTTTKVMPLVSDHKNGDISQMSRTFLVPQCSDRRQTWLRLTGFLGHSLFMPPPSWKARRQLVELVLSFHHVSSKSLTQVVNMAARPITYQAISLALCRSFSSEL